MVVLRKKIGRSLVPHTHFLPCLLLLSLVVLLLLGSGGGTSQQHRETRLLCPIHCSPVQSDVPSL